MTTLLIAGGGTGGHLVPALVVAGAVRQRQPDWRVVLAGAERGIEARILPERDFPFALLPSEPVYRRQWWRNVRLPAAAYRTVRAAGALLDREQPAVVFGTGGYASAPVVWLAARRGVPTAVFEADAWPGLASRLLVRSARHVYLGTPEARARLTPGKQTLVFETGVPIVPPDSASRAAGRKRFGESSGGPTVLVTGGSQGSLAINDAVAGWLREGGAAAFQVIWATGHLTWERFKVLHQPPRVHVVPFLDPISEAYAIADLAVTRAGAITLAELAAWGIPSVLIPLPTAAADHQSRNARAAQESGAARVLEQGDLTANTLGRTLAEMAENRTQLEEMRAAARRRGRPDAAHRIAGHLEALTGAV